MPEHVSVPFGSGLTRYPATPQGAGVVVSTTDTPVNPTRCSTGTSLAASCASVTGSSYCALPSGVENVRIETFAAGCVAVPVTF